MQSVITGCSVVDTAACNNTAALPHTPWQWPANETTIGLGTGWRSHTNNIYCRNQQPDILDSPSILLIVLADNNSRLNRVYCNVRRTRRCVQRKTCLDKNEETSTITNEREEGATAPREGETGTWTAIYECL